MLCFSFPASCNSFVTFCSNSKQFTEGNKGNEEKPASTGWPENVASADELKFILAVQTASSGKPSPSCPSFASVKKACFSLPRRAIACRAKADNLF
jgi:hypothetical protein